MYRLDEQAHMSPLFPEFTAVTRRQDLPIAYVPNGTVYVAAVEWFRDNRHFYTERTRACVMPAERSVDIDTPLDLVYAEALVRAGVINAPWMNDHNRSPRQTAGEGQP
ncbi:hypothetical protein CCP3SC15_4720001 [Gammaproteobacteria bacterium]